MLNNAQQKTLDGLREKGVFGLEWLRSGGRWEEHILRYDADADITTGTWKSLSDEVAYALMVLRGLEKLGKQWMNQPNMVLDWDYVVHGLAFEEVVETNILAAILAALEDE